MKKIRAWHFLQENKKLRWGTQEIVEGGKTYSCDGSLVLCENGMHGSVRIMDALQYAPGPIVCEVEIWGEIVMATDKLVGRTRKVLSMINATNTLHEFACRCAEHAMKRSAMGRALTIIQEVSPGKWVR